MSSALKRRSYIFGGIGFALAGVSTIEGKHMLGMIEDIFLRNHNLDENWFLSKRVCKKMVMQNLCMAR
jgi:hypothetical protein